MFGTNVLDGDKYRTVLKICKYSEFTKTEEEYVQIVQKT